MVSAHLCCIKKLGQLSRIEFELNKVLLARLCLI